MLDDLRDEGTIALDADLVLLLYRPWLYDQKEDTDLAELVVAKQRNGPTGSVALRFVAEHVRFVSVAE
jgi:replicative DNA helicase